MNTENENTEEPHLPGDTGKASEEIRETPATPSSWNSVEGDPTTRDSSYKIGSLGGKLVDFIHATLSLRRQKYDYEKVVLEMKENVVFQGYNVWILICSIVVASIGLNMDSTAVIIGAMLISPLMGPIRGIGFGVGMNDLPLLMKSLKNFGIMVGISLITSTLYFMVSPISIENHQLLSRTQPNFLDAMIAFFGGLAGIIAATNNKNDTVINGVAIATALMPPLCTAGFSLAHGQGTYFVGASYLFLLNSLLIALSTLVLIRYVKFPKMKYLSQRVERKVRNYIILFLVLIILPSTYLFYLVAKKSIFESNVELYVEKVIHPTKENMSFSYVGTFDRTEPKIELTFVNTFIDSTQIGTWKRQLAAYGLEDAKLIINQGEDINAFTERKIDETLGAARDQNQLINMVREKETTIRNMQHDFELYKISQLRPEDQLDLNYILKSLSAEYVEIEDLTINRSYHLNAKQIIDTSFAISVRFKPNTEQEDQTELMSRLNRRFAFELQQKCNIEIDSVPVILQ